MADSYRQHDRSVWESIFQDVPPEWFMAPPSDAMNRCAAFFRDKRIHRLLDVGSGIGRWAMFLAREGMPLTVGLDYAPQGMQVASTWAKREEAELNFAAGDALTLPFREASFDAILGALLLDNLSRADMRIALAEIEWVATRDAWAFFVFNPALDARQIAAPAGSNNPTSECMHVIYTDEEVGEALTGWRVLDLSHSSEGFRMVEARRMRADDHLPRAAELAS
jgi:SAM-dependent methyltransferase